MRHRYSFLAPLRALRVTFLQAAAVMLATGCVVIPPVAGSPASPPAPVASHAEPPGRVGKISLLAGTVTLGDVRSGDTEAATLNWPITTGHRLATERGSRAEVRIGSTTVRLDAETVVDFARVDDELIQLFVQRGTIALRVRNRELLREIDVLTPRERLVFDDVGRYRIDVDRVSGVTAVTAFVGAARIASGRNSFTVATGQRGELVSAPTYGFQLVVAARDLFDDWVLARDQREDDLRSAQYVSRETTGIEALDEYGTWRTVPQYGTVWFPAAVPVGWAPYRYGRWAYIAPWGWTWIDAAPWGFAPFHYGRWALVGGVWCWVPGAIVPRPWYAPALVAWYGAPGVSVSVSVGSPVGWFPLGPGEIYLPPYAYSPRYVRLINVQHVTNIHQITVIQPPPRYVHQDPRRATWAPSDAIVRQRPIQPIAYTPRDDQVRHYKPSPRPTVEPADAIDRRRIVPIGAGGMARPADPVDAVARPRPADPVARPRPDAPVGKRFGPADDSAAYPRGLPGSAPAAKPAPAAPEAAHVPGPRGMPSGAAPEAGGGVARPAPRFSGEPAAPPAAPRDSGRDAAPVARPAPWAAPPASGTAIAPPRRIEESVTRPSPRADSPATVPVQPQPRGIAPRPDPGAANAGGPPVPHGAAAPDGFSARPIPKPPRPLQEPGALRSEPRAEPPRPDVPPVRGGPPSRGALARE